MSIEIEWHINNLEKMLQVCVVGLKQDCLPASINYDYQQFYGKMLLLWWSVDVDDDDPSSLCTVVYPRVTAQSEVGGTVTIADRTGDTSAWWRMDTSLAKMATLSLEVTCFSPPSFEGHHSVVTGGTPG